MGFGGGGGALPNHEHTGIPLDGGPLDFVNTTIASLSAGSLTYSSGAALQELGIGGAGTVLGSSGSAPTWVANTANPLIKVSKTFADIVVGTTSMDIYTLPEDAALVNVWADITTVFDVSTGVTIGDAGDDNGFAQATDWTSGTGLTSATRGAYVTSFKTMLSTSGTTAIKAYNFSTAGGTGSTFVTALSDDGYTLTSLTRTEMCQLYQTGQILVGEDVCKASFFIRAEPPGSPTGTITAMIRQNDGTLVANSTTSLDASTLTGGYVEYTFHFPATTISADDMICLNADSMVGTSACKAELNTANIANSQCWTKNAGTYSQVNPGTMKMTVTYDCSPTTSDTQGEIDFYLQVVN